MQHSAVKHLIFLQLEKKQNKNNPKTLEKTQIGEYSLRTDKTHNRMRSIKSTGNKKILPSL